MAAGLIAAVSWRAAPFIPATENVLAVLLLAFALGWTLLGACPSGSVGERLRNRGLSWLDVSLGWSGRGQVLMDRSHRYRSFTDRTSNSFD